MDYLTNQNWSFPVPIRYGVGRIKELTQICNDYGISKPLLVTDNGSTNLPIIQNTIAYLKNSNIAVELFSDISPNPKDVEIFDGKKVFLSGNHDAVIAMGGGSGMDGGKSISLIANNDYDIWDFEWEKPPPKINNENRFPPLICVPTTAGTGAETESSAMVTDTKLLMKCQGCKKYLNLMEFLNRTCHRILFQHYMLLF